MLKSMESNETTHRPTRPYIKYRLDPRAAELAAGRRAKKNAVAAGKIAASRQPGGKINSAKPPPKIRLKAALGLPCDVNEKLAIIVYCSYEHAVKLQCCTKIGKSEKIILLELCGW